MTPSQAAKVETAEAPRPRDNVGGRRESDGRLSVVILSAGDPSRLARALRIVSAAARAGAQVVAVRAGASPQERMHEAEQCEIVHVPSGTPEALMRRIGMAAACGDIVLLRSDAAIHDCDWIERRLPLDRSVASDEPRGVPLFREADAPRVTERAPRRARPVPTATMERPAGVP